MHKLMRQFQRGFTLIELLIVVAVMAVLLLLTLPAFLDIGRGSKMESAVSQLNTTINLARQWAITKRQPVYLVLPDDHIPMYSGINTNHFNKALRSYAVYVRGIGYVTEWKYLPQGIYFLDQQQSNNDDFKSVFKDKVKSNNNALRMNTIEQLPFPESNSATKNINAIVFYPDGRVKSQDVSPFELYLGEATKLDSRGADPVKFVWRENPVLRAIEINKWTGLTRVIDFSQVAN